MRNHKEVFTQIYTKEIWGKGKGSGTGSAPGYCKRYMEFLHNFIEENNIKHVLDLGCGDWQFSQHVDWSNVNYVGVDVVKSVISDNRKNYKSSNIKFIRADISNAEKMGKLVKKNQVILIKDVLMHWETKEIRAWMKKFIPSLKSSSIILTTNNWKYYRKSTKNPDRDNQPRVLDKHSWAPFNAVKYLGKKYGAEEVFRYRVKQVTMIKK